jgi:hypothetical protein
VRSTTVRVHLAGVDTLLVLASCPVGRGCRIPAWTRIFSTSCDRRTTFHELDRVCRRVSTEWTSIGPCLSPSTLLGRETTCASRTNKPRTFERVSPTNLDKTRPTMRTTASSFGLGHNWRRRTSRCHRSDRSQWRRCTLQRHIERRPGVVDEVIGRSYRSSCS